MTQTISPVAESSPAGSRRAPGKVRRWFAAAHRWTSMVVALGLVTIMTAGVPLLWGAESFRARNAALYSSTQSDSPLSAEQALQAVQRAYPTFVAGNVVHDKGVYIVTDPNLNLAYGVDPGTGRITGSGQYYGGFQGLLENLHAFGLSSPRYPGYLPFMATPIPSFGISQLEGMTLGSALIGILGITLVLLCLSGLYLWWPGWRKISDALRVRRGKARYVWHRELHRTIGVIALPFLLMWGFTGAAAQFPFLQQGLLAVTGGDPNHVKSLNWDFLSIPTDGASDIGVDAAARAATATVPGRISNNTLPDSADPSSAYLFEISEADYDPYDDTMLAGNAWVYVDRYNPAHTKVVWDGNGAPWQNWVYEEMVYPSHFGWYVNGWVRIVWALFGLAPAALLTTGLVSWVIRARRRRTRRARSVTLPVDAAV